MEIEMSNYQEALTEYINKMPGDDAERYSETLINTIIVELAKDYANTRYEYCELINQGMSSGSHILRKLRKYRRNIKKQATHLRDVLYPVFKGGHNERMFEELANTIYHTQD
jgi:biotin operon repressor